METNQLLEENVILEQAKKEISEAFDTVVNLLKDRFNTRDIFFTSTYSFTGNYMTHLYGERSKKEIKDYKPGFDNPFFKDDPNIHCCHLNTSIYVRGKTYSQKDFLAIRELLGVKNNEINGFFTHNVSVPVTARLNLPQVTINMACPYNSKAYKLYISVNVPIEEMVLPFLTEMEYNVFKHEMNL